MPHAKLTPEIENVIRRSTITGNMLVLPEQLPRPLYEAVNRFITNCGGKWNRSAKGHVFPGDPLTKLGVAMETGVAIDEKKEKQQFDTPQELARTIIKLAGIEPGMRVLEPSAGLGMLALTARDEGGEVHCIEIDEERVAALSRLRGLKSIGHFDFLAVKPSRWFDRVVMNPPFAKGQDIKHVAHALRFLKPGGRLVSVIAPMTEQKRGMQELLTGRNFETRPVPPGTFKEAGTLIATDLITIYKQ